MYELVMLTDKAGYIDCPAKIGVYKYEEGKVVLIDSGNDKDAGKKVLKALSAANLEVSAIFNTHLHADHIGGNKLIHTRTGAPIYGPQAVVATAANPLLEPSILWGGCPPKELRNKFMMAEGSPAAPIETADLKGLSLVDLSGHSMEMLGFLTPDGVFFCADAVFSEETTKKYHINFQYDIAKALAALDTLENTPAQWYVPSHAAPCKDIRPLAEENRAKILEIAGVIEGLCEKGATFEEILAGLFVHYNQEMNIAQHALVGSTLRSYLSWLAASSRVTLQIQDNRLIFTAQPGASDPAAPQNR